ncbi:MAG: CHAT domain-containing protein [Verrucomicrobiales bacterium]|nr:CHAT domain-containing protein [Verrucomicrobiales bacterium]
MKLPALCIQTVYFDESDRTEAARLGEDLYEKLTRPKSDRLSSGPGIPIRIAVPANFVDTNAADTTLVIPVLGKTTYNLEKKGVIEKLAAWHNACGPGHVLPVPISTNWRNIEDEMPGKQLLTMLYVEDEPRKNTIDEIILAISRIWEAENQGVQVFISHAKADLSPTEKAAETIRNFILTDGTGKAFFDVNSLNSGESLEEQLDTAAGHGVMISIRGDSYGSRVWCQRELLRAKLNGVPTLTVEVLQTGEARSFPYAGNSPCLVWSGDPTRVASQAMVEWLRSAFFKREADRIRNAANLPDDVRIVSRPPELLDLAQGPLRIDIPQLVLHPDPELSVLERRVLKAARPRMHLATPTTAFRRLLTRRDETADVSSPLEGKQVALSLSDDPGPAGFTQDHTIDATVYTARTLISCGAAMAYGGDFREDGYTKTLVELIKSYNQTASKRSQDLQSYLGAVIPIEDAPEDMPLDIHYLGKMDEAMIPFPADPPIPRGLYFSDMRRVMEDKVFARVVLGGGIEPKLVKEGPGYGGRYPGVIEEAWRSLKVGNPLYVLGGFGGAAGIVADLLEMKKKAEKIKEKDLPLALKDSHWKNESAFFSENAEAIETNAYTTELELPTTMVELAKEVMTLAKPYLASDDDSIAWNGLSVKENKLLFRTQDPVTIAALVSKGLLAKVRKESEGKLQIELIEDSLASAENLDAISIATLEGVPLGGAGAALDHLTVGAATNAHNSGRHLASLKDALIDADWLYLASLGEPTQASGIKDRIVEAAKATADIAFKHGFQRIGIVTYGGNILSDVKKTVEAMLDGFQKMKKDSVLVWYETDPDRYETLRTELEKSPDVKLTTRRALTPIVKETDYHDPLILTVSLEGKRLSATLLPPTSGASVRVTVTDFPKAVLDELARGKATPGQAALDARGDQLAEYLFGDSAAEYFSLFEDSRMVIVHDVPASRLPFELLQASGTLRPALTSGISRKLSVEGLKFTNHFIKPPKKGTLTVLLISNPTRDLPGAAREAQEVYALLNDQKNINVKMLGDGGDSEATVANLAEALPAADILHYCGHAYFDGPGEDESGLILADGNFTGSDLRRVDALPRMAFVNACQAGRVRGEPDSNAAAFAELFLQSGIDAYLGTFWEVGDTAAMLFAQKVYTSLALGKTLEEATLIGRNKLFKKNLTDWANYLLYGGSSFRLVSS